MDRHGSSSHQPIKGDHKLAKSSGFKPPSPSFNSDNHGSRSSSRASTKSPSTHRSSPGIGKSDRRTPSPSFKKGGRKKSSTPTPGGKGDDKKDSSSGGGNNSVGSGKGEAGSAFVPAGKAPSSGDEGANSSKERHRRSRSGPPKYRGKRDSADDTSLQVGGGGVGSATGTSTNAATSNSGGEKKIKDKARAPTDLDKTFLATSSNIEDDVFVEKELEEIQSQLQERAAKVIHNTGSSFTRFTSGLRMADSDPSESSLIKKVSPRRPSVNSLTGYNITDFSDVASENSDISSSRLNFPPTAPVLTVETAAQSLEQFSLKDLDLLEKIIAEKRMAREREMNKAVGKKKNKKGGKDGEKGKAKGEEDDEGRGRPRADSIGPEVRRARTIARHEAANNENNSSLNNSNITVVEPTILEAGGETVNGGGSTTPPILPTGAPSPGTGREDGRPGAPNLQMFASYLGDGDTRQIEVAERTAQREKDHLRDQKLEKEREEVQTEGSSGRSIKVHSFIGSMIAKDKLQSSTESSATTLDNTELETSSDLLCSMTSDTMSDDDVDGDDGKVRDTSGNVYPKSPKQLSFSYGRPPPSVPTLQLEVLRSPKSERKFVSAPDPERSISNLTDGEAAFSPRSISESEISM
mmetsp:Transcript_21262/g.42452  ORF Transcript_21262/g.42452 Transcript_21262/m.42452 type:complete len:636 (-) Transcript_21262:50-1957(-)|eukprot:CAMPEP_0182454786 /NCGR_PEP_ID=MMETSP1319-20130603/1259_1 /TAXON_ID=172717 /ORGANISM="Bolidomonas pacifica, Strain RCC208" /LENGTH=635 /DNA_ID=CAMNT_0024652807 /DNA_START=214 /DNA_END=2121 /DNA_ORIENTATION=-